MKELTKGFISSPEIADWFGISYSSYRKRIPQHLEILEDYCTFRRENNGITVLKVFYKTYAGALNKRDIQLAVKYVNEQKKKQGVDYPLLTGAQMARDMIKQGYKEYTSIKYESACAKAQRALRKAYGVIGYHTKEPKPVPGPYGVRYWTWAIQDMDNRQYVALTREERHLLYDILYGRVKTPEEEDDALELKLVEEMYMNNEITEDVYKEYKEALTPKTDYHTAFFEATGKILTHCQEYQLNEPGAF